MPSYLDFNSTKKFRDYLITKTINVDNGPQTFTENSYIFSSLSDGQNTVTPEIDFNRGEMLDSTRRFNIYEPEDYFIVEDLSTLPPTLNLGLYPYFTYKKHSLLSVLTSDDFENESELFRFASNYIKNDPNGPYKTRIAQNFYNATVGQVNIVDVISGNEATLSGIIKGTTPLVNLNYSITVAKTLPGKAVDFLQTVAGVELPWSEIPGHYLSDPRYIVNDRPEGGSELTNIWQDVTGSIGSLIGIQRRPKVSRKPSDLMIEYMGEGQKQLLFRNLSFSKYGPDYTTTAMSQNSSKLFGAVDIATEAVKSVFGLEAPSKSSYIGDDRSNDVKFSTSDLSGRKIKSPYYLSLLFDPIQTELFSRDKGYINKGNPYGSLTWISRNSKNKLGLYNESWGSQVTNFDNYRSTNNEFREDSILAVTQQILDSLPLDGLGSRSHVANVIDQTSRYFRDGDDIISRGSAVKYTDKNGVDVGEEFCRVWTKDRPYMTYGDTMRRWENIRKFDGSVLGGGSRPWNINIAPMSNGKKSFDSSTNIKKDKNGSLVAKKYMFSIENLAWKTSQIPGFTVNDLPFSERGPNGGRVMWFPPYDLKVNETSSVNWKGVDFIGRPEQVYTYTNTRRTGNISFKVVVDHPSIINLLVRDFFDGWSDQEADDYIHSFFAGCTELDFYALIQRYATLDSNDLDLITRYLNDKEDPETVLRYKTEITPTTKEIVPDTVINNSKKLDTVQLLFPNDYPKKGSTELTSEVDYGYIFSYTLGGAESKYTNDTLDILNQKMLKVLTGTTLNDKIDRKTLFNKTERVTDLSEQNGLMKTQTNSLKDLMANGKNNVNILESQLNTIKDDITNNRVQEIVFNVQSSCSAVADDNYNNKLSVRRSHSILKYILKKISNNTTPDDKWKNNVTTTNVSNVKLVNTYTFKELGYDIEGKIIIKSNSYGEKVLIDDKFNCTNTTFKDIDLRKYTPVAFGCRQSKVTTEYTVAKIKQEKQTNNDQDLTPQYKLVSDAEEINNGTNRKPNIDVMKRIIMKTLSESYYFKKIEETDPLVFSSIKEKLKYFHPAFHSTTPEGLNSRLTFLNQCGRPGDTLPIKGISDEYDMIARNTTFGSPPVCVVRIGDFYNSKILIDNIQISFEDNTWDMNPEGIGVQPMIADVNLSVTFIGGQGLEKPVEQLQNALSSNFYANTEMYDERSVSTNMLIGGEDYKKYTRKFLKELQERNQDVVDPSVLNNKTDNIINGQHIGEGSSNISYDKLVDEFDSKVGDYFREYESNYNTIMTTYGKKITSFIFGSHVRSINQFNLNGFGGVELLGLYPGNETYYSKSVDKFKNVILGKINESTMSEIIGYKKDFNGTKVSIVDSDIKKQIYDVVSTKIDLLKINKNIENLETVRNEVIKKLDNINFIISKGYDTIINDNKYCKTFLENFTNENLIKTVKPIVESIETNNKKIKKEIVDTMNINDTFLDNTIFSEILSVLLSDGFTYVSNNVEVETVNKVNKRIEKFVEKPKTNNFKFNVDKNRKTSKELTYTVLNEEEISSDPNLVKEINYIFNTSVENKQDTLNYYRKNG